ncbi:MAG: hypothetical protein HKN06_11490, partial [Gammaproteobacteria bacterium]|nr:hypothetical protein [Gammaproteobacteria bacterium]
AAGDTQVITVTADIARARHATPQGTPGVSTENETQDLDDDGNIIFNACTGAAGDSKDCWVFADIALLSSDPSVPDVSMPLAARSTGDSDGDGVKDLVDNCPTVANAAQDETPDSDADGVPDICDNCLGEENPSQCDTNNDGFGNHCDADLDNNGLANTFDLAIMREQFGLGGSNDADLNCDGIVNTFDLTIMREKFGLAPGPSSFNP